ncbi:MAG TPA: hypothetical protein VG206_25830 [Terriglobia bacterium]|nr:hypothetical protein [Terriglobia bacterium]
MNCQRYRKWIDEAALGMLEASRLAHLNSHLAACVTCRQAFEAEQDLLAAIDQGIVTRVQGAPSANFATGVRMRLDSLGARASLRSAQGGLCPPLTGSVERAGRPRSQAWWRPSVWSPALALAALPVVLLTLWFVRRAPHPRAPGRVRVAAPAMPSHKPSVLKQMTTVVPREALPVRRPAQATGARSHRARQAYGDLPDQAPRLEVLVEPGQAAALAELYRTMQRGADPIGPGEAPAKTEDPLQVKAVEVKPVVIAEVQPLKPIEPAAQEQNRR